MQKQVNLTEGSVVPTLLRFTFPILLSILLQTTYGTVDLLIVGQFSTIEETSAVTIGSQIMQTVTQLFTGLSLGTTILIGKYIGAEEHKKTTAVIGVSIVLFFFLALIGTAFLTIFKGAIATAMNTPEESFEQTKNYLFVCGIGTMFIVFYNLIGSVFRGIGDAKTPLLTVFIACIVNIVLDIVLIAVFDLGATGAAIATTTAQATSVVLSLLIIKKKTLPFTFTKKDLHYSDSICKKILKLGIPVALQGVLVSVSFLAITAIVNGFGVYASAAVGIVEKATGLILIVPISFMQSLSAFAAQNIGAAKLERAKNGLFWAIVFSLIFGCFTAYIAMFHGTLLTRIFTNDPETTVFALSYLKSYAFDCIFVAAMFSFSGYFNGCGHTTFVMLQSVLAAFFIRIPLAYLFSTFENTSLFLIGMSTPISTFFQIIACVIFYMHLIKKEKCTLAL
ncbi:MAG: MATE family efflux transporter [Bacillota bacterium]